VQDDRGVMKNGEATFRGQSAEDEPEEEFRMVRNKPRKYKRRSDDFNRDSDDGNDTTRSLYTSPGRRGDWEKAQSSSSSALAPPQSSSPPKRATPDLLPAPRAVPRTHAPETGTPACKRPKTETTCEHGKAKRDCPQCGGSQVCEHGRRRRECKQCGGAGICEHRKLRYLCPKCGGAGICEHGKQNYHCPQCGGAGICEHGKQKQVCRKCHV